MAFLPESLPEYAELHCLSNFSFLRGASHPEELVEQAAELGYSALALMSSVIPSMSSSSTEFQPCHQWHMGPAICHSKVNLTYSQWITANGRQAWYLPVADALQGIHMDQRHKMGSLVLQHLVATSH